MSYAISQNEVEEKIQDCIDQESKLTPWEASFIDGLEKQMTYNRLLSHRQTEILINIHNRISDE